MEERIDDSLCSVVHSGTGDSDAARERAETDHAGTGDECAVPIEFDGRKEEQSHCLDTQPGGPAKYLGG